MARNPVIAWGPEKYLEVRDPWGRLHVYLALFEDPPSELANTFCERLFPGLSDIIKIALPYAHTINFDGSILWFSHHLWDADMNWFWSFTKE